MTDHEIAASVRPLSIANIAERAGIPSDLLTRYGDDKAKVGLGLLDRERPVDQPSRLILVSAITPTPAGEGKTTTSIGLTQGLNRIGRSSCVALREPSLGPCMGMKGGATGGGYSQITPADSINLHFTGDIHAVSSAHNLLAALLDNHLHFKTGLRIDPRRVLWRRVIDMNDRALRDIVIGLGGTTAGIPRETGFDISAASEIMAILCLAQGYDDLRARIDRVLVAFDLDGAPLTAADLGATGALVALLKDAMQPNLVQTLEGTPAFVHGGPFANIAHGCSSVIATRMAMHVSEFAVTEAGFGFDLGAEKFFDIKCRGAGLDADAIVLVATCRALKMHGGVARNALESEDVGAIEAGLPNLEKHLENINAFGKPPIVALNRFASDSDAEIAVVRSRCEALGVPFAVSDHHARGGEGAVALAELVVQEAERSSTPFSPLYSLDTPIAGKVLAVAQRIYGAREVVLTKLAKRRIKEIDRLGYGHLPICIAKTQKSLSDDPRLLGRPRDFDVTVRDIQINAGSGFLVVLTGDIMRMPGLPRVPNALEIDVVDGAIVGLK